MRDSMYSRMVCCCPITTLRAHRRRILVPKDLNDTAYYLYYKVLGTMLLRSEKGGNIQVMLAYMLHDIH